MDKSNCRRACSSTSTAISKSFAPIRDTRVTFGRVSSWSARYSAASRRLISPRSEVTTKVMTSLTVSARSISGCSAFSGGKSAIRSTAASTSSFTSLSSTESFSSMVTRPMFSAAEERTSSMPSMPSTASSTRRVMASSTSLGVAPG